MSPLFLYQRLLNTRLTDEEYQVVESWISEYPYFALPHYLKARQSKEQEALFSAALYSPNRTLLKRFMDGSMMLYEKKLANMFSENQPQTFKQYSRSSNATFSILSIDESSQQKDEIEEIPFKVLNEIQHSYDVFLNYDVKMMSYKYTYLVGQIDTQIKKFSTQQVQFPFRSSHKVIPKDFFKESISSDQSSTADTQSIQDRIIEEFLAQDSLQVRPDNNYMYQSHNHLVENSLLPDEDLASETLAQLHLKQNNKQEAIRIYQRLSLLFPEKKAYFADQINKIS